MKIGEILLDRLTTKIHFINILNMKTLTIKTFKKIHVDKSDQNPIQL